MLASLVGAGALTARSAAPPEVATAAGATYVPTDGAVSILELTSSSAGPAVLVQEHQRATGFGALSALPQTIAVQLFGLFDEDEIATLDLWRITSRQLRDGAVRPTTTDVYQIADDGLYRLGATGGSFPTVYDPPLLTVPADPRAGDSWTGSGSALFGGVLTYDYEAEVLDIDDDGCVDIGSTLSLDLSGEPFTTVTGEERWCPGTSVVSATGRVEQAGSTEVIELELVDDATAAPTDAPRPSAPAALPASDPAAWVPTPLGLVGRDPMLGDMVIAGITALPPTVSDDGLVVVSFANGGDIVGMRLGPALETDADQSPRLIEQWRAHPGGSPLAVRVLDDLIIVSTSQRTLAAYDLAGVRRWSVTTDDLVLGPAVRTASDDGDSGLIVAQDLSGRVTAWQVDDGRVAWRAATRADSDLAPVVLDDLVIAADRSGDLLALDATTGRERWRRSYDRVDDLGVAAGQVIVDTFDGTVRALGPDGDERWATELDVWLARIDTVGGHIALIGSDEAVVLDPDDGDIAWRLALTEWADGWAGGLAVHRRDEVCLHDTDGREARCWPIDTPSTAVQLYLVATPAGLWTTDASLATMLIGPDPRAGR